MFVENETNNKPFKLSIVLFTIFSSDPRGGLDRNSPFSKWRGFCPQRSEPDDCHVCDPTQEQPELWRTYNEREVFKRLPSQGQLDYLMTLQDFDTPPFDREANASSFRNVLEGFIDANNNFNDSRVRKVKIFFQSFSREVRLR